ncbi:hypothetical protein [Endozoicomonas sp. ISHI1]|uniref:hypothetical protein n=1 Tax=Endozoicomonas sp. ISHI1 TaxID=2825882 RepID=UPI002148E30A|nr:hypothetical protein [Endozoicomonas sp. ISHI1]
MNMSGPNQGFISASMGFQKKTLLFSWSILPLCQQEYRDKIIKRLLFATLLLLLVLLLLLSLQLLSVACMAESLTEPFIIELEQTNQSFSIKRDLRVLPDNPSDITHTEDYAELDSTPDDKRHSTGGNKARTTIIVSISWQWLYVTQLLAGYELILKTKDVPLFPAPYSWVPVEAVVAVGWFLRSYRNSDSPLFNLIEHQEATSMLKQRDFPLTTITMMTGSGDNQQHEPSESSGQRTTQTTTCHRRSFTNLFYSGFGGYSGSGGGSPLQHSHTLGLNCFVHPCHGACQFGPPYDGSGSAEWSPDSIEHSYTHFTNGPSYDCIGHAGPLKAEQPEEYWISKILDDFFESAPPYHHDQLSGPHPHDINRDPSNNLNCTGSISAGAAHTIAPSGPLNHCPPAFRNLPFNNTDDFGFINEPADPCRYPEEIELSLMPLPPFSLMGTSETQQTTSESPQLGQRQLHPSQAGTAKPLPDHRIRDHSGYLTCYETVVGDDGQSRPCGKVCKNHKILSAHKYNYHSGQRTCETTVVGEGGQQRPCGKVCQNSQALSSHKVRAHTGERSCEVIVTGEDGQPRPCGKIYKNAAALSSHKSGKHTRQKTCFVTMIGWDGQPRPCGRICKNAQTLASHKNLYHSGQKTCDMTLIAEDGRPQPCGKVFMNGQSLSDHKRVHHSEQKTCDSAVVGEDGQLRPCGKLFKSSKNLSAHKRSHRKRKPVDETPGNPTSERPSE